MTKIQYIFLAIASLASTCSVGYSQSGTTKPTETADVLQHDPADQTGLHVYLLIGQSNMAGRANIAKELETNLPGVYLLDEKAEWSPASNPLNRFSTIRKGLSKQKLGPGYTFAQAMQSQNEKATIGLVVNARGGTRIQAWAKGTQYYKDAIARTKVAMKSGTLKGILWHQGEGNSKDKNYLPKLVQLVADLRADLGDAELPFVAGMLFDSEHRKRLNAQLQKLPQQVPHTACVSSVGLTASDGTHFDTQSQLEFGKRYAEAMAKLVGDTKK